MTPNEHIEDKCQKCGGNNPVWSAANELWNAVIGSSNGILCPTCFFQMATEKGIDMFGIVQKQRSGTKYQKPDCQLICGAIK